MLQTFNTYIILMVNYQRGCEDFNAFLNIFAVDVKTAKLEQLYHQVLSLHNAGIKFAGHFGRIWDTTKQVGLQLWNVADYQSVFCILNFANYLGVVYINIRFPFQAAKSVKSAWLLIHMPSDPSLDQDKKAKWQKFPGPYL